MITIFNRRVRFRFETIINIGRGSAWDNRWERQTFRMGFFPIELTVGADLGAVVGTIIRISFVLFKLEIHSYEI